MQYDTYRVFLDDFIDLSLCSASDEQLNFVDDYSDAGWKQNVRKIS